MHESTGVDGKLQCTHLLDVSRLAMAHALTQTPVQYDVSIEDRVDDRTVAEVLRNGEPALRWDVHGPKVIGPDPFTDFLIYGAPKWPQGIGVDTLEAAWMLRRVFFIAPIREPRATINREPRFGHFNYMKTIKMAGLANQCYGFRPEIMEGVTYRQTWRNYAGRRDDLLRNFPGVRTVPEAVPALAER
jgi:hypothetical protein